jgi:hypothetical protein
MRSLGHLKECSDQRLAHGFVAGQVGFGEGEDALQLFWRPTPDRKREGAKSETMMPTVSLAKSGLAGGWLERENPACSRPQQRHIYKCPVNAVDK